MVSLSADPRMKKKHSAPQAVFLKNNPKPKATEWWALVLIRLFCAVFLLFTVQNSNLYSNYNNKIAFEGRNVYNIHNKMNQNFFVVNKVRHNHITENLLLEISF